MIYPSIYEINYEDNSTFNTTLFNDKLYRDKTKIFHLEAINICDLEAWNKCFKLANIKHVGYSNITEYLKSDDFHSLSLKKKKQILEYGEIHVDYAHFGEVCCDIQKNFSGSFNFVGENFAKIPLVMGTLQNYIYQYISNCVFGVPSAYAALQNMPEINKVIESLPKKLISNLTTKDILQSLYNAFVLEICSDDESKDPKDRRAFLFKKKNVIEFSLFYKSTLNFNSSDNLKNYLSDEIVKSGVPDCLWKLYFILN
jgi:hypothetical protein